AAESPPRSFTPFEPVDLDGVVCYRKRPRDFAHLPEQVEGRHSLEEVIHLHEERALQQVQEPVSPWQARPELKQETGRPAGAGGEEANGRPGEPEAPGPASSCQAAAVLFRQGLYPQAAAMLIELGRSGVLPPEALTLLIRSQANQGRLPEALAVCEEALREEKLDPALHFLRAEILQEQGRAQEARQSLRQALYLDPKLVLAHFALGNLTLWSGKRELACRHFDNALAILNLLDADAVVPGSEGMTAGRLKEIIASMEICAGREQGEKQ
ncbi:tetratricopeptide repeat protein, partial [Geomonas sp.]|uniref:tetratricopeptide repeat protein n=1 Tax=Geomonas sp. TaxID=2651584 RepID=UPI002B495453